MNLTEFLREDGIILGFSPRDKWEAIGKLAEALQAPLKGRGLKAVQEALVARERAASTGLEHGIAIPHAKVHEIEQPLASLGISPQGVQFQSQDNLPARLIVLVLIPMKAVHLHIRTLAAIAHLLNFEEMRRSLLSARTPQEVLRIIREEEQKELLSR